MGQSLGRAPARAAIQSADINDGIITSAHIAADSIVAADIASDAITLLEIADDAVGVAELSATGTASTSTFLRGDNSWYAVDTEGTGIKSTGESGGTKFLREDGDGTSSWQTAGSPSITDNGDANAMTIGSDESVTFVGSTIIPSIKQPSSKAVTGTFASKEMLLADTYSLTGNATINSDVVLGSLTGSDVVLLSDSTSVARTITGSGTLEIGEMTAKTPSAANIIAGGLTADADIQKNVDAALEARGIKKNVVVGFAHNRYTQRRSGIGDSDQVLWNRAVTINKRYKDTHLHFTAVIPGHGKHCYPFFGTYGQVTTPTGQTHKRFDCSHYWSGVYTTSNDIHWQIDLVMTPAECFYQTGNFYLDCGWQNSNGGGCRPFNVWNPNNSDDSRGYQKGSTADVTELYLGEGQGEDS